MISSNTVTGADHWLATGPARPAGEFAADRAALARHCDRGEELLTELPPPAERTEAQRERAGAVHRSCRRSRTAFLAAHADRVYAELTDGGHTRLRIAELAARAAEVFPGLAPTAGRMAAEDGRRQADKEGREIDQGILFAGLLRCPSAGDHLLATMLQPTARATGQLAEFRRAGQLALGAVHIERIGGVAHLTIQNDHCLNAEDNGHVEDMETAVDLALLDPEVKVGVVRGGPMSHRRYAGRRVFSSGINLKDLHAGRISFVDFLLRRELGYIRKITNGIAVEDDTAWPEETIHKPWVAAVDGFAIGGGAQLLLVFDRVIAAADTYFSLPAAQEGIVPGAANFRLARHVGDRLARQVILGGRKVWAREPAGRLLFDEVVDPSAVDMAVADQVGWLANPAVVANRRMLNLAVEPAEGFRAYMAEFAVQQALRAYSPDVLAKVACSWTSGADRSPAGAR